MEEEERPRKMQKVGHEDVAHHHEELGPVMTGAVGVSEKEQKDTDAATAEDASSISDEGCEKEKGAAAEGGEAGEFTEAAEQPKMSKNQLKKLRRKEHWEAQRELRKAKRKEKLNAKRAKRRAALAEAAEKNGEAAEELRKAWETPKQQHLRSTLLPITFVIDCDFDELMNEKERISLGSQLTRSYSDNYRAPYRSHLVVTSFGGHLKERFDTVLRKTHENWKGVRFMSEDYMDAAEKAKEWMTDPQAGGKMAGMFTDKAEEAKPEDGEVVYLTSDSPHTLTELKPYSTYIIGGIVDKNRHKGICYKRATERGVKTAKLPIGEYIQMASRQVLATNHVVEIMLKWLELGDWGEAFIQVIPRRKGGTLKDDKSREGSERGTEEAETPGADSQATDGPHEDHKAAESVEGS